MAAHYMSIMNRFSEAGAGNRLRPAEVFVDLKGNDRLIRKKETFDDLIDNFI